MEKMRLNFGLEAMYSQIGCGIFSLQNFISINSRYVFC